ncbi:MAG: hypothetical protein PHX44_04270 [Sulfurimonas sp.]|uniref:hypothetical protein n=1 Tax=Sulfurimonas sp. TaxID=2022749 RepID=UPI00261333EA|nr:hypothetical protein [Sulfurimonas sp.]MDD2652247.1 hypothetical protein [Sulfurimonas sp.]MDD3451584.1 hypothetical protein [Sulfurimonas sp.]
MYEINKVKLIDLKSKSLELYLDPNKAILINDLIFASAIVELIDMDTSIIDKKIFIEKFKIFKFDDYTTNQIVEYLFSLFLYVLHNEEIINKQMPKPISKIDFSEKSLLTIQNLNISYDYDIPYLAGYSADGKTIYIDKIVDLPRNSFDLQALSLHEYIEKSLFQSFKNRDNLYFKTHQIALRIEELFVSSLKNKIYWEEYQYTKMKYYIDKAANKLEYDLPQKIDVTPYKDCGFEDYYFIKNDSLLIALTLPVFMRNFENNYNKIRKEEINEHCSLFGDEFKICSGNFLGFNDYLSKSKSNAFGYISNNSYYTKKINDINFSIKETFIYYGYGIGFFEIILNSLDAIDYSKIKLSKLNSSLINIKEAALSNDTFELLSKFNEKFKNQNTYLTTSFSISYFVLSSSKNNLDEMYRISTELCGEHQSSKNIDEFEKSGIENIYINHGFTGSVYYFENYQLETNKINSIKATNHFLYLISTVIPELNFLTQNIIKYSTVVSQSNSYIEIEKHLDILKNIREKVDSLIFDTYPQNVNEFAIDASIYDKAFESWEFEKYILILKEQNKKIENLIQEFDTKLKHISDKKLNVFVKLLTGFSATSVFVDTFSHINLNIGFYFLIIPLILIIIGLIL